MKHPRFVASLLGLLTVGAGLFTFQFLSGEKPVAPALAQGDNLRAPEFPAEFKWLNVDKPLSLRALKGKIVLLDFWTYGCINCMHILPDLHKLERKYPNELVIIGVHSAKFQHESDAANIRNAMLRYNIEHPILVDEGMKVWESYAVRAWPTFVLIDPAGRIAGSVAGEGNYNTIDQNIGRLSKEFRDKGLLNETPLKLALDAAKVPQTDLWYPGKVLADGAANQLFVSDSNHNRVVISDLSGKVLAVAGSGERGFKDGAFDEALFSNPQGLALQRNGNNATLYVADTNNHAIRALDLNNGTVKTIAGTGAQAPWRSIGGTGTRAALASPWDLLLRGGELYIAMAGPHQIWKMNLKSGQVGPYAGSGREARLDGTLKEAAFAQPSGLATDGKTLFIADSEISAIRGVDLPPGAKVQTLAGGDLFDFGDVDGFGDRVRLQHPLGLDFKDGVLYIADTYNSKIKTLDPQTGQVSTWLGGKGDQDGANAKFYEPGGLSFAGDKLFVADTNNHKIRVVNVKTKSATTLKFDGLPTPKPAEPSRPVRPVDPEAGTITLPVQTVAPGQGNLVLDLQLPAKHHLNKEAPQRVQLRAEGQGVKLAQSDLRGDKVSLPLRVPLEVSNTGEGTVIASTAVYYCSDTNGTCLVRSLRFKVPYKIAPDGAAQLTVKQNVE
jgi:DNA-binding beta-propeller fold protein YncE